MTPKVVALLVGASAATWTYNKIYRRTGGNEKNSYIVGGLAGLAAFIFTLTLIAIVTSITGIAQE